MKTQSAVLLLLTCAIAFAAEPESELLFPLEDWHNHSSSIAELPDGSLFVVWFHGSGERRSDDVEVRGARRSAQGREWTRPFTVADNPGFPDTNTVVFVDSQRRLWHFWMTFIANEVETTILNQRVASDYLSPTAPLRWDRQQNLLLRPDLNGFEQKIRRVYEPELAQASGEKADYLRNLIERAGDKYTARTGWMVRTHPLELPSGRMLLGLYSDVYDLSLVAVSDDHGASWRASEPIVGPGAVQPSLVRRNDGAIVAFMRDNGPPPQRVMMSISMDEGETWGPVVDIVLPNPGSSVEALRLAGGRWLIVYNDTEEGRHSLAVSISEDEGKTWPHTQHLELVDPEQGSFSYPSVIQAADGSIHVTYSYALPRDSEGKRRSAIKHARFTEDWLLP